MMSFFIMTSSIGFTIDIHFCGNEYQSFALLGKAKKCEKENAKPDEKTSSKKSHACCKNKSEKKAKVTKSCHQSKTAIKSGNCCHNKILHVENNVVDQPAFAQNILIKLLVAEVVYNYNFTPVIIDKLPAHFFQYKPPPIVTDANIQYQVFRI